MITEIWENPWSQTSSFKKIVIMFKSSATDRQRLQRNFLLRVIQIALWVTVTVMAAWCISFEGNVYLLCVTLAIALRFEFWVQPYLSWRFSASGREWAVTGIRDNPVYQTKFFTMRYHGGEACPLW